MIDPKMLELSVYDRIPHLLAPVVTEPPKAIGALKWTVREMEKRYRAMSQLGVRNIGGYNEQGGGSPPPRRGADPPGADRLRPGNRQAGLRGPAARPLAPADDRRRHRRDGRPDDRRRQGDRGRGAAAGADGARRRHPCHHGDAAALGRRHHRHHQGQFPDPHQLPGHQQDRQPHHPRRAGRRAAARPGRHAAHGRRRPRRPRARPLRLRRARSSRWWTSCASRASPPISRRSPRRRRTGRRRQPRLSGIAGASDGEKGLFDQAVALVSREGKASTSFIQRHLNIGYNRAAKLIEQMEKEGVVGPANHVGKREVLTRRTDDED